jgi:hypothetical protein
MRTIGYIYKYRKICDWTDQILRECELFYSSPKDLNDPFDCNLEVDLSLTEVEAETIVREAALANGFSVGEALKAMKKADLKNNQQWRQQIGTFIDQLRQQSSVCCFSTTPTNSTMFAHYCENHTGICLQFSLDARQRLGTPLMVEYGKTPPELRYTHLRNRSDGALTKALFLWKDAKWEYEDEWRVVRLNQPAGTVQFLPGDLMGVMFGSRATADGIARVKAALLGGRARPLLYHAKLNRATAALEMEPMPW